jgi:anti-repressor protein
MNELMNESTKTISSKVISEITGKQHSNVMVDIRNLLEQLGDEKGELVFQLSSYLGENSKMNPMYELTKKEALLLASGYNAILRLKIINRLEELETVKPRTHLEVIDSERLLLLSNLEKDKVIERMKPKEHFFDQVTGSENCFDMADVAKVCNLGIGRNTLFQFLRDNKVLRENNTPYQNFCDCGYFRVIESKYNKPDGSININLKTVVYQKGIDFIIKRYVGRNLKQN